MYEQTKKELDGLVAKGIVPGISYASSHMTKSKKGLWSKTTSSGKKVPCWGRTL